MSGWLDYMRRVGTYFGRDRLKGKLVGEEDPTGGYKPTLFYRSELIVNELPLFTLYTARLMEKSDPIVTFAMNIRNAALMAGEVEVTGKNPKVVEWVQKQWKTIWEHHGQHLLNAKRWGFAALQPKFKMQDGLIGVKGFKPFAPQDVRALMTDGEVSGFRMRGVRLHHPRALWQTFSSDFGLAYGTPLTKRMYPPWWEKWMDHGAKKLGQLRMIKDAWMGDVFEYPHQQVLQIPDGAGGLKSVPWRDVVREMAENRLSGAALTIPMVFDKEGRNLVKYTPPQSIPGGTDIFDWEERLDEQILRGGDISIEVIKAPQSGSGYSGRSIPLIVTLSTTTQEFKEIVADVDKHLLRPMAWLNFGGEPEYEINAISLVKSFSDQLGGSPMGGSAIGGQPSDQPPPQGPPPNGKPPPNGSAVQFSELGGRERLLQQLNGNGHVHPDDVVTQHADETHHAPSGGVTIQGRRFKGGEFIPSEVFNSLSAVDKAKLGPHLLKSGAGTAVAEKTITPHQRQSMLVDIGFQIGSGRANLETEQAVMELVGADSISELGRLVKGADDATVQKIHSLVAKDAEDQKDRANQPTTGEPFEMNGYHATSASFDRLSVQQPRTKVSDLTARGIFFYGDKGDAERLYLNDKPKRIIEAKANFKSPFVFKKWSELYEATGVDHKDPDKADKNTAALKEMGHDGYIKLYQTKPGIDEAVVLDDEQVSSQHAEGYDEDSHGATLLHKHGFKMSSSVVGTGKHDTERAWSHKQHGLITHYSNGSWEHHNLGKLVSEGVSHRDLKRHLQTLSSQHDEGITAAGYVTRDELLPPADKPPAEVVVHKFSSTQFNLPGELAFEVRQLGDKIAHDDLAKDGRELNPHLTCKYGLHTDDPEEVRTAVQDEAPVAIQFGNASHFEGDGFDVVKIEVISDALRDLNRHISESLEVTDTHPDYKPHVTIAYVKSGLGEAYAGKLNTLKGRVAVFDRMIFSDKRRNHVSIPLLGTAQFGEGEEQQETTEQIASAGAAKARARIQETARRIRDMATAEFSTLQTIAFDVETEIAALQRGLTSDLSASMLGGELAGQAQVWTEVPLHFQPTLTPAAEAPSGEQPSPPPAEPPTLGEIMGPEQPPPAVHFPVVADAIEVLHAAPAVARPDYRQTAQKVREGAFAITGDLTDKAVADVKDILQENIAKGPDRQAFVEKVLERLQDEGPLSEARVELIFRQNVASALSDGMNRAANHPMVVDAFPYRGLYATTDARCRGQHLAMQMYSPPKTRDEWAGGGPYGLDGTNIYRADDPVFNTFRGPWDWGCRCHWTVVSVEQAASAGVKEAQEWLARAKAMAAEKGGSEYQYFVETAPATPQFVEPPPFKPSPEFVRQ